MQPVPLTPAIWVARVRLQSTSSLFLAVSPVPIPATCSTTPAAWALQPEPSGKELPEGPARRTGRINQKTCRERVYQPGDKLLQNSECSPPLALFQEFLAAVLGALPIRLSKCC